MRDEVAITIGNFDGVHCGHTALLRAARARVEPNRQNRTPPSVSGGKVVALVFDPHPRTVLLPASAPPLLTTFHQRCRLLAEAGADECIRLEPTTALLGMSPEQFLRWVVDRYTPTCIVEGPDFRFGRDRTGSLETLRRFGANEGIDIHVVEPTTSVLHDQSMVIASSSLVRWLLERGRVSDATRVLGRPYTLEGIVARGEARGRTIGFPTANLRGTMCLLPADGVYAGWAMLPDGARHRAAVSVGTNPTFGDAERQCEAHLIGFNGRIGEYDWVLTLSFDVWLRGQIRYDNVEPLIAQIKRDVARTQVLLDGSAVMA